jgi:hypothetical protein
MRVARFAILLSICLMLSISSTCFSQVRKEAYEVIVKNDLFKPLGWNPQPRRPSFQLLITAIDSQNPANSKAMISMNNQSYYIKVGEKIGEAVLKEIHDKRVIVQEGEKSHELKIEGLSFGGGGRGERPGRPRGGGQEQATNQSGGKPEMGKIDPSNIPPAALNRVPQEIRERFMNASPEERREMMRQFIRNRRGERRQRGRVETVIRER